MKTRRQLLVAALLVLAAARLTPPPRSLVPDRLTSQEFWKVSSELSEPSGTFRSDNLLSNERLLQHVIPALTREIAAGSAYLGVGPEQNFTYIAALKPSVAFIVDIRRGNLQLHLLYKALFELSADRVEFVSRLFSRTRPPHLTSTAPVGEIFQALLETDADPALFADNLRDIRRQLSDVHKMPLAPDDLRGIEWIYQTFYSHGPLIQYSANFGGMANFPTYMELMTATDAEGMSRSYLASPDSFAVVKTLHAKNLLIPIVGDFAGPKAIRGIGRYLMEKHATVGAFYLSNVEQYLGREGRWSLFCENVSALPLTKTSSFIRSIRDGTYGRGAGLASVTGNMLAETKTCPH